MKLVAEIEEEELLFKLMHVLGATFYRDVGEGTTEVVYFSGEKIVHFKGKLSDERRKLLVASGWKVQEISISEIDGMVKIRQ